jgi:hypothetical protein
MSKKWTLEGLSRRRILESAGAATVVGGVAGHRLSGSVLGRERTEFVIEQDGECVSVEPLSDGDVVDLYGYESDERGADSLPSSVESAGVSRSFLYDGPNGLSLVVVHGGENEKRGGSATFLICGLPPDGEFVVLDDEYEGATDEFETGRREAVLNWTWGGEDRSDGAVFRGLGTEFCLDVRALWNDDAKLVPSESGTVEKWEFLTGSLDDPEVVELNPAEPMTVRTGSCDADSECCGTATETVSDPFAAEFSFCCTTVLVNAETYDRVWLNLQNGTEQDFDGPFEGTNAFRPSSDGDFNTKEHVVRSVRIESGEEAVRVENPNAGCCLGRTEGTDEETPTPRGE